MIKIQEEDFHIDKEIEKIKNKHPNVGAVSTFIGYVRNINNEKDVQSIKLEVYKEMAFKKLESICFDAFNKWSLIDTLIIHRYGDLMVNDKIVLVATFSKHRKDGFESCEYIMDYLKKDAPFWKKENYNRASEWQINIK